MAQRTDDDVWDLSSSVGATATMVATSRALASRSKRPLISDPYADPLVRAVGLPYFIRLLDGENPSGDPEHDPEHSANFMAVRTRFYDDHFRTAVDAGVRQVVILAAGLDTRAYRMAWPAGTTVYELDLAAVLEFKAQVLGGLGATPTATHHALAVDLRDDWPAVLRSAGLDPALPTVWSAEGLLPYLPGEAQDLLFDRITALSAQGSSLACDVVLDMTVFGADAGPAGEHWKRMDVSVNELVYQGDRRFAPTYLAERGWHVDSRTLEQLHADNGVDYPQRAIFAAFADMTFVRAWR
jgi:methyltransferase (TIGR00027 family)